MLIQLYMLGIVVNRGQLDFVKEKIANGEQPWKWAYDSARWSRHGQTDYKPKPWAVVECGPSSNPNKVRDCSS